MVRIHDRPSLDPAGAGAGSRRDGAAALLAFATVVALGAWSGGYFPVAWGWSTLALLAVTAAAALTGPRGPCSRAELALLASLGALALWALASTGWSLDPTRSVLDAERLLLYLSALTALLLTARRGSANAVLRGVHGAALAICAYALGDHLLSPERSPPGLESADPYAAYRLAEPIGYGNALGLLGVIGILLGLGFAARSAVPLERALAAAGLVVFAAAVYLTFSRGAVLALAAGIVVLAALHPERHRLLPLLALAPAPALAVVLASRSDALTRTDAGPAGVAHAGRLLAAGVVLLAACSAAAALLAPRTSLRRPGLARLRRVPVLAVVVALVAGAGTILVAGGGPRRLVEAFETTSTGQGAELDARLLSLSGSGRADYWRVAWKSFRAHPLTGSGAGGFAREWLRLRPSDLPARDAHGLYLETLAELGPIGAALLTGVLAIPAAALLAARRRPLAPFAGAAYAAYLVHAGADWDWELPAVTTAALFCGVAFLPAGRGEARRATPLRSRTALLAAVLVAGTLAAAGLAGNHALAASSEAYDRGAWARAAHRARRAAAWMPWSAEPWRRLGEAQAAQGLTRQARASFREGLERDARDWELWLDLALLSSGRTRERALAEARRLNPRSTEVAELAPPGGG